MNKLTNEEIKKYEKQANKSTGVDAITIAQLESINLDEVREVELNKTRDRIKINGENVYKLDRFTPRSASYAFKPSFAGKQVLIGRFGRNLIFSNGRWFCSPY
jgi:hypothetical protein